MKILINIVTLFLVLFLSACSDSKNEVVIKSFSNDLNESIVVSGRTLQIRVFANYSNDTQKEITQTLVWSSLDETMASVEDGLVSANNLEGDVRINYKTEELLSDGSHVEDETLTLSIKDLVLESIKLSQEELSLSVGSSKNIEAIGIFEDGYEFDITDDCLWSSSDSNISSVESGLVSAISEGNATVSATDSNITSNLLAVNVIQKKYISLEIKSQTTEFNVKQTIELQAVATMYNNETVILENSEVSWQSDDEDTISIENEIGIATAVAKGDATVKAIINEDTSIEDTLLLSVKKDVYMRLFRDGVEVSFPYAQIDENETLSEELSEFTMTAIGQDFNVSGLSVENFSGTPTLNGWFDNLDNSDVINKDDNRTFKLMHNGDSKELHYYFKINDEFGSEFSQKYKEGD